MKKLMIGAASVLAIAAVACGQNTAEYDDTADATEAEEADDTLADADAIEEDDELAMADEATDPYADPMADETTDPYADPMDTTADPMTDPMDTTADPMAADTDYASAGEPWIEVATVETKDDLTAAADAAFTEADANADGMIDRTEFLRVAAGPSAAAVTPSEPMVDDPATPEDESAQPLPEGDIDPMAPDATTTAPAETMFTEIAGADATFTKEELRQAFLDRFEQADENGDDMLDQAERDELMRLTMAQ